MLTVYCPDCGTKKNIKPMDVRTTCTICGVNLYDYFIREKTSDETKTLIKECEDHASILREEKKNKQVSEDKARQEEFLRSTNTQDQKEDPNYHGEINVSWVLPAFGALVAIVTVPIFLADLWTTSVRKWNEFTSAPTIDRRQEFINSLGKNQTSVNLIDLKEFAEKTATETELQNDMTENELKDTYVKLTGTVVDVDSKLTEFGQEKYQVQLWEPKAQSNRAIPLIVTANCYANSDERELIINTGIGDRLTIIGKVESFGDLTGLQIRKCSVVGHICRNCMQ